MTAPFGAGAPARFATTPTPGARHDAAAIARLARVLGRPLMPWQRQVARVATERDPDDPRRFRYPLVLVSVPRQSGKTTLAHAKNAHRTIAVPRRQALYTAQTGKDARKRWHDCRQLVVDSPLRRFVDDGNRFGGVIRLAAGDTGIVWPNGSLIAPFAPTAGSLHGYTPDCVDEDEVWYYDPVQGEALDGAIGPAQITLPHRQRWMFSTMGDADSTYWHQLVDDGRAAVEAQARGERVEVAYFEWSAGDDVDLYDPDVWPTFHPAIGHTIEVRDLAVEAGRQSPGTWQRAYCNRRTSTREAIVDLEAFERLADLELRIDATRAQLAYDVAYDSSQATITLAMPYRTDDVDDLVAVRVVRSAPGVAWLADAVVQLCGRWKLRTAHADDGGPTRDVTDELRRRGFEVTTTTSTQYATACGAWLRRCRDGRLRWDGSDLLRDAMAAAKTRPLGDAIAFSRRHSSGPIDALVAGAVSTRAALLAPPPPPPPMVRG
jgi:phage terminase large subunit-like protein